jgi:outer membrane receptor protein involved in Fe transport
VQITQKSSTGGEVTLNLEQVVRREPDPTLFAQPSGHSRSQLQWRFRVAALTLALALAAASAGGSSTIARADASDLDAIQVTADRFAEQVQEVPNSIEVNGADELRARGVNDLRTALSLLGGVFVAPGSDEGPAAAVPGLLGLREVDDFLLLVDGVPAGSVFIPQFATLNLTNVERIEVQRGGAPVLWGTTVSEVDALLGGAGGVMDHIDGARERCSYGSISGNASAVLSQGNYRASLIVDGARDRYSDPRSGVDSGHLLMRNAANVNGGELRLDFDATAQRFRFSATFHRACRGRRSPSRRRHRLALDRVAFYRVLASEAEAV